MKVRDALPSFAVEFEGLLASSSYSRLVGQVNEVDLASRCGCGDSFCSTFYVTGARSPLTIEEQQDRGPYSCASIDVDAEKGIVIVHTDELDRIVEVEVLYRPDVESELVNALGRTRNAL